MVALILVLVFGAGGAMGFAMGHRSGGNPSAPESGGSGPDTRGAVIHQLDLTGEQQVQVDSILEHHRERWVQVQEEVSPRFREIVDATRDQIYSILEPEQRAEYDSLLERAREERRSESEDS